VQAVGFYDTYAQVQDIGRFVPVAAYVARLFAAYRGPYRRYRRPPAQDQPQRLIAARFLFASPVKPGLLSLHK